MTRAKCYKSILLATVLTLCCFNSCINGAKITNKTRRSREITNEELAAMTDTTSDNTAEAAEETNAVDLSTREDLTAPSVISPELEPPTSFVPLPIEGVISQRLSFWRILRGIWNWLKVDISESLLGDDYADTKASTETATETATTAVGRTFGKIRRLQMALIPIMFKFGILSAMIAFLVMLGMKTLLLVKFLVLLNAVAILGKFLTLKTSLFEHAAPASPSWGYSNWNPHANSGWSAPAPVAPHHPPHKEIHLHIHGVPAQPHGPVSSYTTYGSGGQSSQGWERSFDPYNGYESSYNNYESDAENELNNAGPFAMLPKRYPANHRY